MGPMVLVIGWKRNGKNRKIFIPLFFLYLLLLIPTILCVFIYPFLLAAGKKGAQGRAAVLIVLHSYRLINSSKGLFVDVKEKEKEKEKNTKIYIM